MGQYYRFLEYIMQSRTIFVGGITLLGAVVALAAVLAPRMSNLRHGAAITPGTSQLVAFTSRGLGAHSTPDVGKMDAALADLARHAPRIRPGHELEDLHSMNPAARFRPADLDGQSLVLIDAVTRGDANELKAALLGLGLEHASVYSNDVGGWLPVSRIADAAARPEVSSIRATMVRARAAVATQGDYVQRSSLVRSSIPSLTGAGVTVGVLSDSFDCYAVYAQPGSGVPVGGFTGYAFNGFTATAADDEADGALPATVNVLAEPFTQKPTAAGNCLNYGKPDQAPFTDEGRAMMQVVHAVAPGASLMFFTGDDSEAAFANGILTLAGNGAKVITDDLGYFDEPFYQDGMIAQAIDAAAGNGVAYFSAAGNNADSSWESTAPSFGAVASSGPNAGERLLNFDTSGTTTATSLPITINPLFPGQFLGVVVQWDQPYSTGAPASPGATSHINVCVTGATGTYLIVGNDGNPVTCTGANATGVDPVQILIIGNPASASGNTAPEVLGLSIGLADATGAPGRLIVSVQTDGQTNPPPIGQYATHSESLQGHAGAAGGAAVGAAFFFQTPQCGTSPALLEPYSAQGGAPVLFDTSGNRLATPILRQKPDFVAPDGINTTFLGFLIAQNTINGIAVGNDGLLPTSVAACQNNPSFPNFFGTSAAAPHAAGIAALMLQANSTLTPAAIYQTLRLSALPMTGSGPTPNFSSGYGFIQADAAFVIPALTLSANSTALGSTSTLSWTTVDASACTATGDWSGAQLANATVTLKPLVAGVTNYTLTCTNATGASAASTVSLSTTASVQPTAVLSLGAASIVLGQSTSLTWSSTNATACTASGSWTGAVALSNTKTVSPAAVGTYTYTLSCSNASGSSPSTSVTLAVTAAPASGGGGGGGALDVLTLFGLAGLALAKKKQPH